MRHRKAHRKLNRTTAHRKALLRNMVTEFLDKERIVTTVPKAKELRPFAEKMITLGKRESLHARRQALSVIRRKGVVHKLFEDLAPRFADRAGGYTRIIRLGPRRGDATEMAIIELVGEEVPAKPEKTKKRKAKGKAKPSAKTSAAKSKPKTKAAGAAKPKAKAKKSEEKEDKPAAKAKTKAKAKSGAKSKSTKAAAGKKDKSDKADSGEEE